MKTFADLTNTSIVTARAQWKDLNSRLMKLPRLSRKSPSPRPNEESEDMTTQDCIIVRDEIGNAPAAGDESEREAKYKTKAKGKRKQVAKPSIIDDEDYDLDEEEDRTGAKMMAKAKGKGAVVAKQSVSDDSTKKAWADVGDGMDEEKWNQMGDKLAF
ncbi:hypothetical protein diail_9829 [Diaporthe ilicicola]|nr:hypothetical protein diail_9829 [Diaporthe ilicicola]